ncbi:hypothetical protein [Asticcacaulis taihuensis]|uniref:Uncharacterized protein n=1 Tax=Asticcacaulis taihuensis TaxID=260084 RepID=A0A1G4PWE1_9CAUL|nr:hypothetical protein [Asticcacaulis taihuensis]SCW36329.1 hypothetical protein SAMN02927928_0699 [Asticcacaulis taihuensis]
MTKNTYSSLLQTAFMETLPEARLHSLLAMLWALLVPAIGGALTWYLTGSISYTAVTAIVAVPVIFIAVFLWKAMIAVPHRTITEQGQQIKALLAIKATEPLAEHDIRLFRRFNKVFGAAETQFLRAHNFYIPLQTSHLDPINDFVAGWDGPTFEFRDPVLDAKLAACKDAALHFYGETARMFTSANPHFLTVRTDLDRGEELTEQTQAHVQRLTTRATELLFAADAVTKEAIARGLSPLPAVRSRSRATTA